MGGTKKTCLRKRFEDICRRMEDDRAPAFKQAPCGKGKERRSLISGKNYFFFKANCSSRKLHPLLLPLALYSSSVTQVSAPKEQAHTQAGCRPCLTRSLQPSHLTILPSEAR